MTDDEKKSGGDDAFSMFPDLMGGAPEPEQKKSAPAVSKTPAQAESVPVAPVKHTPPPEPPDISWLVSGEFNAKVLSMGVPTALLLMADGEAKTGAADAFKTIGYQIEEADSEDQAILKMNSGMFAAVVLHQDFVGGEIGVSVFHNFMKSLGMAVRRPIFYVLIGEQFHTLYDLEALSESANVVVNTNDVKQLGIIIRKGLKDYEKLFGPLVEAQRQQGTRS